YFDSPHDALKVLEVLTTRREPEPPTEVLPGIQVPADLPGGFLTEPDARRLLEAAGIPTTRWQFAADTEAAVQAARALGDAVAIKAVSARIVHKSDIGGVKLGLRGDAAVRQACNDIAAAARAAGVETLDGFLVTEMWRADTELILGVQRDPDFGPLVMVGAGGVLVELMKDVQLAPAPLSHATARAMLGRLRCLPLLTGYRGRPAADLDAIADTMVRLGALAADASARLCELDINPLFIAGDRIAAADARATLA
ncbi:MAG TPA: acetate--CoA ligase family protein, partial [Ottowia sp.]|nr:acetate--CoA ligase family protein [Ottowia sp.]